MKFFVLQLILLINVLAADLGDGPPRNGRIKRQGDDDRWSWGYIDSRNESPDTTTAKATTTTAKEPTTTAKGTTTTAKGTTTTAKATTTTAKEPTTTAKGTTTTAKGTTTTAKGTTTTAKGTTTTAKGNTTTAKGTTTTEKLMTTVNATAEENPCTGFEPKVPDFRGPGRRISNVKCYEYIFDIKRREDQVKRSEKCRKYLIEKARREGGPRPHFAIGGRDTFAGEFPHMGAIGWQASIGSWMFKCGGSLISEKFLLTAGHCTSASLRDTSIADVVPKIVRLGDKNIIDVFDNGMFPVDKNIIKIIPHPEYKPPKKYFDIALIELDEIITFDKYIQPACLWTGSDEALVGRKATLTGWGVVETVGKTTSPELQAAVVDVIPSQQCDQLLKPHCNRHWCGMRDDQICAGKLAGGVDACQGDSGGPLQIKIQLPQSSEGQMHYIIGVTSFGIGCALPNLPGIYTRVSSFVGWIEDIVWK